MQKTPTPDQMKFIARIREFGGEAVRDGAYFRAGGWTICDRGTMDRMARKGLVKLETVGMSTFAVVL